jgi:fimbrial isopeptide formation D2 family protein/LPXTG-motif cell wall-anchored protein
MKKISALVIAMVMVLAMALPAMAADGTITTNSTTHTYEIYQIFKGNPDGNGGLTSLVYGQNTKDRTVNAAVSQADITALNAIRDAGSTDALDQTDITAIAPYVNLESTPVAKVGKGAGEDGENTTTVSVPQGYYLIKDKDNSLSDLEQYTLYIMSVLNDTITITPKSSTTTSEKKIKDKNDSVSDNYETVGTGDAATELQDSADYDIGDNVPYVLTAHLAENVSAYKKYHIDFVDTLESGKLKNNKDYVVKINGTATTNYTVSDTDDGFTLTLTWGNGESVIGADAGLDGATITVEFSAELLSGANIGAQGNINTFHLEYSNNPNDAQGGEEGTTPDDKVIAFTYKITVNKKDEANQDLKGATFSLYKKYAVAPQGGTAYTDDENSAYKDYYLVSTIAGTDSAIFTWSGIDDGQYLLVEDVAPTNYNAIAPQAFTVTATHDIVWEDQDRTAVLTDLSAIKADGSIIELSAEKTTGLVSTDVINQSGATLPSTGGIGTTIFYVIGGVLVVLAGIVLVTRRKSAE